LAKRTPMLTGRSRSILAMPMRSSRHAIGMIRHRFSYYREHRAPSRTPYTCVSSIPSNPCWAFTKVQ
jgi:hypothetical protein